MNLFLDTNVLLDVLQRRPGFMQSARVIALCEAGNHKGGFTSLSACNIAYIMRKQLGEEAAEEGIRQFMQMAELIDTTRSSVQTALSRPHPDFEDAVQLACAEEWGADVIITRNKKDFVQSRVQVQTPAEFISSL